MSEEGYRGWVARLAKFKAVMEAPVTPTELTTPVSSASRKRSVVGEDTLAPPPTLWVRRGSNDSTASASTAELSPDDTDDYLDDDDVDESAGEVDAVLPVRKRSVTELDGAKMRLAASEAARVVVVRS